MTLFESPAPQNTTDLYRRLFEAGYTRTFAREGDHFVCREDHRVYAPEAMAVVASFRFEGESNPDDMSVIYAIRAPDGNTGTIVDAFGTYADDDLGELVARIPDERSTVSPHSTA